MSPAALVVALAALQGPVRQGLDRTGVFSGGTPVPIRFTHSLAAGRDRAGSAIAVQTMADLEAGGCVLVPAYAPILGTVVASEPGRLFGKRGYLALRFDSLLAAPGVWVPLAATLDSLEWAPHGAWPGRGIVTGRPRSVRGFVGAAGAAGVAGVAAGVGLIPAVAFTGVNLVRRGPGAQIFAGERGALRLHAPLVVRIPGRCERPAPARDLSLVASLPPLPPRASNQRGTAGEDPINLLLGGTREEVDSAFTRAGWLRAEPSTFGALAREAEAIVLARRDSVAPMSHEFYRGRVEDLRFERASPSARVRHHVRLWQADSSGTLWAAAATQDVGVLVSARRRTVTHRIAPQIDRERELLVGELLAGGCAALRGYVTLPGARAAGASVAGQPYVTDARAAVLRLGPCPRYAGPF
jgi:hypothetical protein